MDKILNHIRIIRSYKLYQSILYDLIFLIWFKILSKITWVAEFLSFQALLNECSANTTNYSSRETRQLKKELYKNLASENIENLEIIIDYLADLKIFDYKQKYDSLINNKENILIFKTAYNIVMQSINANNIIQAVESSSKMIFTLKAYSLSTNEIEKVETDINTSISDILKNYKNQLMNRITLQTDFDKLPIMMTYPEQMSHLWNNLIYNSIQAIENKGEIKITTKNTDNKIIVTISDSGKGIAENIKDKIFEPFFTTKGSGEGIGLGLDICKRILDNHNGKIYFETAENEYTHFYVEFLK